MIRNVDEDLVGRRSLGGFIVSHKSGAAFAFHEKPDGSQGLAMPISREGMDVMPVKKDCPIEIVGGEIGADGVLPPAAKNGIEFWNLT